LACTGNKYERFSSFQGYIIFRAWHWVILLQPTHQCLRILLAHSVTVKHNTANTVMIHSICINRLHLTQNYQRYLIYEQLTQAKTNTRINFHTRSSPSTTLHCIEASCWVAMTTYYCLFEILVHNRLQSIRLINIALWRQLFKLNSLKLWYIYGCLHTPRHQKYRTECTNIRTLKPRAQSSAEHNRSLQLFLCGIISS
jgi:hypothetical protein